MTSDPTRLDEVFLEALSTTAPQARAHFLDEACRDNAELRSRVEALLAAHEAAADFLPTPNGDLTAPFEPLVERPGSTIGRYKLLEQIGEGGFGVVFMAEQEQPVRRRVALKIIKLGMDTKQVVARFEAERQALALMDHPNIAKVFDAGATETGRPYFVMELVRGVPITEFCDKARLPANERLKLMQTVCSAVQHAHQKGIIHRDLKPSNVLVTLHDDVPVPKVIDFGVAKATQARLTERTLFTEFRQMIGTPTYMSPEQAQMSGLDVDTRSDVYSLGVMLYELLTGSTPIELKSVGSATYDDIRRLICEVDPPSPSARLSTLTNDELTTLAKHRHCEPRQLVLNLRSDLDWIVMKCLEKDRKRRYESASALAQDLKRYLDGEPIEARPPSKLYRVNKFVRRNKVGVLIASSVASLAITAIAILAISNIQIRRALAEKDYAIVTASTAADSMLFRVAYDKLAGVPNVEALRISLMQEAVDYYSTLLQQIPKSTYIRHQLAGVLQGISILHRQIGEYEDAIHHSEQAIEIQEQLVSEYPENCDLAQELATLECGLAYLWSMTPPGPDEQQMEIHYKRAYDIAMKISSEWPDQIPPMTNALRYFALCALNRGDRAEAERYWRQAIQWGETVLARESPQPLPSHLKVGNLYSQAKFMHADKLGEHDIVSNVSVVMPNSERKSLCWAIIELATSLIQDNRFAEAESALKNGMNHVEKLFAENSELSEKLLQSPTILLEPTRGVAASMNHRLAMVYSHINRIDQAIPFFKEAVQTMESLCDESPRTGEYWRTARYFHETFVDALESAKRDEQVQEAVRGMYLWIKEALTRIPDDEGTLDELIQTQMQIADLLRSMGQNQEADEIAHLAEETRLAAKSQE